jgi:hypothetical protein
MSDLVDVDWNSAISVLHHAAGCIAGRIKRSVTCRVCLCSSLINKYSDLLEHVLKLDMFLLPNWFGLGIFFTVTESAQRLLPRIFNKSNSKGDCATDGSQCHHA